MKLRLVMDQNLLKSRLPVFMARTILPLDPVALCKAQQKDQDSKSAGSSPREAASVESLTVLTLMAFVYKQVKPMLRSGVDPGKLYFTSQDGFFLPPNATLSSVLDEP